MRTFIKDPLIFLLFTQLFSQTCMNEIMPQELDLACSIEYGIIPGTNNDLSDVINTTLLMLSADSLGLYFPAGDYRVSDNIQLYTGSHMVGSSIGTTIFRSEVVGWTPSIGDNLNWSNVINGIIIRNLVLDNIIIHFYGGYKTNIIIEYNAIINTDDIGYQIHISHTPFIVHGNLLMRGPYHPGSGIGLYRNKNTIISGNYVGDILMISKAFNYIDVSTQLLVDKVKSASENDRLLINSNQGNYISAITSSDGLTDSKIHMNFIVGNKLETLYNNSTELFDIYRDHVIYCNGYKRLEVSQNYLYGWPKDAHGQAKFRNATGLYFAANYLDSVSFHARPYNSSSILSMSETFIFNNYIKEGVVNHYQGFEESEEQYIDASNYVVFNNIFDNVDILQNHSCSVWRDWRSLHGEYLASENILINDNSNATCDDFVEITMDEAIARLPLEKLSLFDLEIVPLTYFLDYIPVILPNNTSLIAAYPNPFNSTTIISYVLSSSGDIDLSIYNISGQLIDKLIIGYQNMGNYSLDWDANSQPSGMYIFRLTTKNGIYNQKLMLIK